MPPVLLRGGAVLLAALAFVLGSLLPAAAVRGVPGSPGDVLTLLGEGGDLLGHGTLVYSPPSVIETRVSGYQLAAYGDTGAPGTTRVAVSPPEGDRWLRVGSYTTRTVAVGEHAALSVTTDFRGCGAVAGTMDVLDVSYDDDGHPTSLALDFSFPCDGERALVHGSLRWNSEVPYRHTSVTAFDAPDSVAGRLSRGTVTLTNSGSLPQTYGRTTWEPDAPAGATAGGEREPMQVVRDGCAGRTLAPGTSCAVDVRVESDGVHDVTGRLRTPDGTLRRAAYTPVTMRAVPGAEPTVLVATPERGAVVLSGTSPLPSHRVLRRSGTGPETPVADAVTLPWTDASTEPGTVYSYRLVPLYDGAGVGSSNVAVAGALPQPTGHAGMFVPVGPVRVVDTRVGTGVPAGAVPAGGTLRFDPAAGGHVPADGVEAVVLSLTGTQATEPTHLRVRPAGDARPEASSVDLVPGRTRSGHVVVPLGADGTIEIGNDAGTAHVLVDVQGFYSAVDGPAGAEYLPADPVRVLDTRTEADPVGPGESIWVPVLRAMSGRDVVAVDVNLTVTTPTAAGHLTAWSGGVPPGVAHVSFEPGETVANHAVVPVRYAWDGTPGITVRNSAGATHLVVDVQGVYSLDVGPAETGRRFASTRPSRLVDTRATPDGAVVPGDAVVLPATALPAAVAHVVTVTATRSTRGGHLTVRPAGDVRPRTSTLNFVPGEDSANLATVTAGTDGTIAVSAGTSRVDVVVDHVGYFY